MASSTSRLPSLGSPGSAPLATNPTAMPALGKGGSVKGGSVPPSSALRDLSQKAKSDPGESYTDAAVLLSGTPSEGVAWGPQSPSRAQDCSGELIEEANVQLPEAASAEEEDLSIQPAAVPSDLRVLILKRLSTTDVNTGDVVLPRKAVEEKQKDFIPPDSAGYAQDMHI